VVTEAFDALQTLVDHHLLKPSAGSGGAARYVLHPAVREFARERLAEGPDALGVGHRHATFFQQLAERAATEVGGGDQASWLDRLDADHEDLRAAVAWMLAQRDADGALRLVAALKWYWFMRGHLDEGRSLTAEALALAGASGCGASFAAALDAAGWLAQAAGDGRAGQELAGRAVALVRERGDRYDLAWTLNTLGFALARSGLEAESVPIFEESLALFREHNDDFGASFALSMLGFGWLADEQHGAARGSIEEALALARKIGDAQGAARALLLLGWLDIEDERTADAVSCIAEAVELSALLRHPYLVAYSLEATAALAQARGDVRRCVALAAAAERLRERTRVVAAPALSARLERRLERAVEALSPAARDAARRQGRERSLEQMIAEARHVTGSPEAVSVGAVSLTPREVEVLQLVADGFTDAQIAQRLFVSVRTVNAHLRSVYTKLGVSSRAAATRMAAAEGVLT
jgi:non-specific serine/threonine protein kinase